MKYVGASYKIQAYRRILMEFVWVTYFISTAIYYLFNDRVFNFNKNSHCLESFLERRYNHIHQIGGSTMFSYQNLYFRRPNRIKNKM